VTQSNPGDSEAPILNVEGDRGRPGDSCHLFHLFTKGGSRWPISSNRSRADWTAGFNQPLGTRAEESAKLRPYASVFYAGCQT
jgi:hypothetical protein